MKQIDSRHPAGTVGYITGGVPRYYQFFDALEATEVPRGTHLSRAWSCNPAKNSNGLLELAQGEWLWIQGDDHTWPADTLIKLLDHDVDVVVPLVCRWAAPWLPVIYKKYDPKGTVQIYSWSEIQLLRARGRTLVSVEAAGSAGMLVRRHVWEAMRTAYGDPVFRVGHSGPDELAEDLEFTWKANQLGFDVCADLSLFMGHLTPAAMTPYEMDDGSLAITAQIHGGRLMAYTIPTPEGITPLDTPKG